MDVREKMVELICRFCSGLAVSDITPPYGYENLADFMISNGVTVQEDCKYCAEATQNCIVKLQDQISELRSAHEWISVDDRLPEPKENAICINRHGAMMIGAYTEWGWMFPCYFEEPTHWMPMPQPPKGE